jgi:RNA polymerase sigma-70 factor (ECF subfamily)
LQRTHSNDEPTLLKLWRLAYHTANGILRDPQESEDMAQESILAYICEIRKRSGENQIRFPDSWIRGTARNLSLKHRSMTARLVPSLLDAQQDTTTTDMYQALDLLLSVPKIYRTSFELRYVHGATIRDIARTLGVPEGTVKWRLYTARKYLRRTYMNRQSSQADEQDPPTTESSKRGNRVNGSEFMES